MGESLVAAGCLLVVAGALLGIGAWKLIAWIVTHVHIGMTP